MELRLYPVVTSVRQKEHHKYRSHGRRGISKSDTERIAVKYLYFFNYLWLCCRDLKM